MKDQVLLFLGKSAPFGTPQALGGSEQALPACLSITVHVSPCIWWDPEAISFPGLWVSVSQSSPIPEVSTLLSWPPIQDLFQFCYILLETRRLKPHTTLKVNSWFTRQCSGVSYNKGLITWLNYFPSSEKKIAVPGAERHWLHSPPTGKSCAAAGKEGLA